MSYLELLSFFSAARSNSSRSQSNCFAAAAACRHRSNSLADGAMYLSERDMASATSHEKTMNTTNVHHSADLHRIAGEANAPEETLSPARGKSLAP